MSLPNDPRTTAIILLIVGTTLLLTIVGTLIEPSASSWAIPLATGCLSALLTALTPPPAGGAPPAGNNGKQSDRLP